jgi:hypothetical protein
MNRQTATVLSQAAPMPEMIPAMMHIVIQLKISKARLPMAVLAAIHNCDPVEGTPLMEWHPFLFTPDYVHLHSSLTG